MSAGLTPTVCPAPALDAAMGVLELVGSDGVMADLEASSKKHALEMMAAFAAESLGLSSKAVFTVLVDREKLGSTGVGRGIAIPHAKMAGLEGIHGFLIRSREAVPFEAVDDEPVDLFFLLLAPESAGAEHLKALARVSRALRDRDTVKGLREAAGAAAMRAVLEDR